MLEITHRVGHFNLQDLADSNMAVVLDTWLDTLQWQALAMAQDHDLMSQSQFIPRSDRQPWAAVNVWFGLKVLLGLMQVSCSAVDTLCKCRTKCH